MRLSVLSELLLMASQSNHGQHYFFSALSDLSLSVIDHFRESDTEA